MDGRGLIAATPAGTVVRLIALVWWLAALPAAVSAQSGGGSFVRPLPPAPGAEQPGLEYRIEARLDEAAQRLESRARIRYRNNTRDTIPDFWFHLYLNAFRPNSLWARTDLANGITTFQDLGPDEHGYERIQALTVDGAPVLLRYPFAPDSTIVGFDLPRPLAPGASIEIELDWHARTSSVPRRQGREGRQWDFAQWYPRVVVHDDEGWRTHPLQRAGEFYGEFATYDVTLEVAGDQVMGATGVPVAGDPGWEDAAAVGTGLIAYDREWYGSLDGPPCVERGGERVCGVFPARPLVREEPLGLLAGEPVDGRKRVRWYAEDVHHFAWSTSPDYIYEQGRFEDVTIHVLYRPGDEEQWGNGVAVRRTALALEWLHGLFGDYPYPQVTNLHRIEGGGTEFPMLVMNGSASQGLILHEVGHIYAHGILANNEWYEGWLDEGLTSFQTAWFNERRGGVADAFSGQVATVLARDVAGRSEPVVLAAEDYSEFGLYSTAIYTKGSVIFWMLRELAGEEKMTTILRTYFDRHRFTHVDSDDFRAVAEEVLGMDLDWFFAGWLHTTGLVDYAIENVAVEPVTGGWRTVFTVARRGQLRMPVTVRFEGLASQAREVRVEGAAARDRLEITTSFEPRRIVLDPRGTSLDWNPSNNGWARGLFADPVRVMTPDWTGVRPPQAQVGRVPVTVSPLLWGNDAGGLTAGVRLQSNVMDARRASLTLGLPAVPVGPVAEDRVATDPGSVLLDYERAGVGDAAGSVFALRAFVGEGRAFASVAKRFEQRERPLGGALTTWTVGASAAWVTEPDFLIAESWTPEGNRAGELQGGWAWRSADADLASNVGLGIGFDSADRRWARLFAGTRWTRALAQGWSVQVDGFAGAVAGRSLSGGDSGWNGNDAPAERRFSLGSGDAWAAVGSPFLRSRGAALDREGWIEGGGTLRGIDPRLAFPWVATVGSTFFAPEMAFGEVRMRPFFNVGLGTAGRLGAEYASGGAPVAENAVDEGGEDAPGDLLPPSRSREVPGHGTIFWSTGPGVELRLVDSPFRLRLDLPLAVSHPEWAGGARDARTGLRIQVGLLERR